MAKNPQIRVVTVPSSKEVWRNFRVTDIYDMMAKNETMKEWFELNELNWSWNWIALNWDEMSWIESNWSANGRMKEWIEWIELTWTELNWIERMNFQKGSLARKLRFHIFNFLLFEGSLARKLSSHIFHFHFLREVSHESWVLTSSTFKFWRKSRTKASFLHLPLSLFEGCLARKLCSTFTFGGKSRTKASSAHLQLSEFEVKSRIVMAVSRLLGAAAVCAILFTIVFCSWTS